MYYGNSVRHLLLTPITKYKFTKAGLLEVLLNSIFSNTSYFLQVSQKKLLIHVLW